MGYEAVVRYFKQRNISNESTLLDRQFRRRFYARGA